MPRKKQPVKIPIKPFFYIGEFDEPEETELPRELPFPHPLQNPIGEETTSKKKCLTEEETKLKWKILQNVVVISFAFMLFFTSLFAVSNLQPPINTKLGTISLWAGYVALIFSCTFFTTFLIQKIKAKWAMIVSMLACSTYIAAHFYPTYYTLIPAAIILGLAAGPMWSAKCVYMTMVGKAYGKLVGEKTDVSISRFFGIFFCIFHWSRMTGNLISSAVLFTSADNESRSDEFLDNCGVNFCPHFSLNLTEVSLEGLSTTSNEAFGEWNRINMLALIYLIISIASALLIAIVVDSLSRFGHLETKKDESDVWHSLVASFQQLKKPNQLLIIPLTIWCGIEQAYLSIDFTKAFVTCGLGVHMIGYVMITDGLFDSLCSLGFIPLVKNLGRGPIIIFGASLNVFIILIMFLWKPNHDEKAIFFFIPAIWGVADAIWQTQLNALYGVMFPKSTEAAFSNYRLWETLGYLFAYVLSFHICIVGKLYLNLAFLFTGIGGYFLIETLEKQRQRSEAPKLPTPS